MIPGRDPGVLSDAVGPSEIAVDRVEPALGVVALRGEHDLHTAEGVRSRIQALLGEGCAVSVDLRDATFLDSSILAVFVEAQEQAARRELGFSLALSSAPDGAVRRVLEITGLSSSLNVFGDLDTALAAAKGEAA
jgi:anti-anti-sigma factor